MAESKPTAETRQGQTDTRNQNRQTGTGIARQQTPGAIGWSRSGDFASPFAFFDRMAEEMDRTFDRLFSDFGLSRRSAPSRQFAGGGSNALWSPRVESFQKGDQFVVRAELPGMQKDDVQVELTSDALTIQGERHAEQSQEHEGYYHSEREYGRFYRTIPLPEGVIGESAKASFKNGVLEVTMQAAPAEANRGRRLEIKDDTQPGSGERK